MGILIILFHFENCNDPFLANPKRELWNYKGYRGQKSMHCKNSTCRDGKMSLESVSILNEILDADSRLIFPSRHVHHRLLFCLLIRIPQINWILLEYNSTNTRVFYWRVFNFSTLQLLWDRSPSKHIQIKIRYLIMMTLFLFCYFILWLITEIDQIFYRRFSGRNLWWPK